MQETQEMWVQSLGEEDPLEEEMAIHSSILAWKIPGIEEPGRHRVTKSWTLLSNSACTHTSKTSDLMEKEIRFVVTIGWRVRVQNWMKAVKRY